MSWLLAAVVLGEARDKCIEVVRVHRGEQSLRQLAHDGLLVLGSADRIVGALTPPYRCKLGRRECILRPAIRGGRQRLEMARWPFRRLRLPPSPVTRTDRPKVDSLGGDALAAERGHAGSRNANEPKPFMPSCCAAQAQPNW